MNTFKKIILGMTGECKDELLEKKQDDIELDLELVGATAIEDKLQVDVGMISLKPLWI